MSMLRMRRITQILAAATVAAIAGINTAKAGITLSFTPYVLGGSAQANSLNAAGYVGIRIDAIADATSVAIGGFDLDSGGAGIKGTIFQRWAAADTDFDGTADTINPSVSGLAPTAAALSTVNLSDSFFDTFAGGG